MQTASGEQIILLRVGWAAYETLINEIRDSSAYRIAYDGEILEIMQPSSPHEEYIRLFERLIGLLAQTRKLKIQSYGSSTMRKTGRFKGGEPDGSYYIKNAAAVIGKRFIDFTTDPAPDIVLEVDLSNQRLDKNQIYDELGITEFWRYDGNELHAQALRDGVYEHITISAELQGIPIAAWHRFMEMRLTIDHTAIGEQWVDWLNATA